MHICYHRIKWYRRSWERKVEFNFSTFKAPNPCGNVTTTTFRRIPCLKKRNSLRGRVASIPNQTLSIAQFEPGISSRTNCAGSVGSPAENIMFARHQKIPSEVFTAVIIWIVVFWVVTQHKPIPTFQKNWSPFLLAQCGLHLLLFWWGSEEPLSLQHVYIIQLIFNFTHFSPEDGGITFFRNYDIRLQDYSVS
jgi:hypothetical protein